MDKLREGRTAPELNVKDVSGDNISLKSYREKTVLLSFYLLSTLQSTNSQTHSKASWTLRSGARTNRGIYITTGVEFCRNCLQCLHPARCTFRW